MKFHYLPSTCGYLIQARMKEKKVFKSSTHFHPNMEKTNPPQQHRTGKYQLDSALTSSLHLNISTPEAMRDTNTASVLLVFRNPQGANNFSPKGEKG